MTSLDMIVMCVCVNMALVELVDVYVCVYLMYVVDGVSWVDVVIESVLCVLLFPMYVKSLMLV